MKKTIRTYAAWILVGTIVLNTPGYMYSTEQTGKLTPEKISLLKRLVKEYRETNALYRKKKEGKASLLELYNLESRMIYIKRRAIIAGFFSLFILLVLGLSLGTYKLFGNIEDWLALSPGWTLPPFLATAFPGLSYYITWETEDRNLMKKYQNLAMKELIEPKRKQIATLKNELQKMETTGQTKEEIKEHIQKLTSEIEQVSKQFHF